MCYEVIDVQIYTVQWVFCVHETERKRSVWEKSNDDLPAET